MVQTVPSTINKISDRFVVTFIAVIFLLIGIGCCFSESNIPYWQAAIYFAVSILYFLSTLFLKDKVTVGSFVKYPFEFNFFVGASCLLIIIDVFLTIVF